MVRDNLPNASLYYALGANIAHALRSLEAGGLRTLAPGQTADLGGGVMATSYELSTRKREDGFWEAHRQFIDVQYVQSGVELMGYAPLENLRAEPYEEDRDLVRAEGEGDFFRMSPGAFVIFWPGDAHMPGVLAGSVAPLRKVVIKVPVRSAGV
jgi:YhcH/YjgK/YiaL family protein